MLVSSAKTRTRRKRPREGRGVAFGTGLGAPEFLNVDLVMALLSVAILLSPEAKTFSLDALLARRNPALSVLLTNRGKQLE